MPTAPLPVRLLAAAALALLPGAYAAADEVELPAGPPPADAALVTPGEADAAVTDDATRDVGAAGGSRFVVVGANELPLSLREALEQALSSDLGLAERRLDLGKSGHHRPRLAGEGQGRHGRLAKAASHPFGESRLDPNAGTEPTLEEALSLRDPHVFGIRGHPDPASGQPPPEVRDHRTVRRGDEPDEPLDRLAAPGDDTGPLGFPRARRHSYRRSPVRPAASPRLRPPPLPRRQRRLLPRPSIPLP